MANQVLYGGFRRLGNFPLDPSSIFKTNAELQYYLEHNPTAYEGQQVVVTNDPNPDLNGGHTVHFETEIINGEKVITKVARQSASIEQVVQKVKAEALRIETEVIRPLETSVNATITEVNNNLLKEIESTSETINEKITTINNFIGITGDSSGQNNSVLNRIENIETVLELNDADAVRNSLTDLENEIKSELESIRNTIGDSNSSLSEIYATKEELTRLEDFLDRIDDQELNDSFQKWTNTLDGLAARIKAAEINIGGIVNQISKNFDNLLITSFNKENSQFKYLVEQTMIPIIESVKTLIKNNSDALTEYKNKNDDRSLVIEGDIRKISNDVSTKASQQDFLDFQSQINNSLKAETANVRKTMYFDFNDSVRGFSLPENIIINEVRLLIENPGTDPNICCRLCIANDFLIDSTNLGNDSVYFDEVNEFIIEKTIFVDNKTIEIIPMKSGSNIETFAGATGKIFVSFYSASNEN